MSITAAATAPTIAIEIEEELELLSLPSTKAAPVALMERVTQRAVFDYLRRRVTGQDVALQSLSAGIADMLSSGTRAQRRIYNYHLAGTSGVGKTHTKDAVRELLGMTPGAHATSAMYRDGWLDLQAA